MSALRTAAVLCACLGFLGLAIPAAAASPEAPVSWQAIAPPDGYAYCFVPHPDDDRRWIVCSGAGFHVTQDGGATYRHFGAPILKGSYCQSAAVDPLDANRMVVACGYDGLYISEDRGNSWTLRSLNTSEFLAFVLISSRDGSIWVGPRNTVSQHGVFRSEDHGRTFQFLSFETTSKNLIVWDMLEDPDTGALYAGTEIADHPQPYKPPLFLSTDRGLTWKDVRGTIGWHVVSFAYDAVNKETLALTEGPGLYKTSDQGRTWTRVAQGRDVPSLRIVIDPAATRRLWGTRITTLLPSSITQRDSILVSPDMGVSWSAVGLPDVNSQIAVNRAGTRLYVTGYPPAMWIGTINGAAAPLNAQGLWWSAPAGSESGWGINFSHQGDIIFATWFTYDAAGKPWWLIAELRKRADGAYAGPVSTVTGPPFDAIPFDPGTVVETAIGSATVTFANGNAASLSYSVNGLSQTKSITRQVWAPPGTVCH